ncbi:fungal-specific transcription factor domain-containing protein [Morchella snyderi]|nr:fungal-specific transcription factor domain-containing protein [Morchella snyderi]
MAMLDRRLKRMEERLIKNVPKEEVSSVLSVTGRSVVRPSLSTNSARSGPMGKKRTAGAAFGNELETWARSENPIKHRAGGLGDSSVLKQADPDDGSQALPSKEIQEHLVETFFEFIYGQPYYLLHKPSFMRRLRNGTAPPVLVLAICAISARFSKHPAVRHNPPFLAGESFATEARRLVLKNFDNPNITNVTVCTLLCLHEFGTCQGGRSWAFGGMATRMAHALQLHREINNDPIGKASGTSRSDCLSEEGAPGNTMSFVDREIRRRCMWACFVMDRFTSSGTERPCLISESEIEIQLPSHDRNLELDIPTITERLDGTVNVRDVKGLALGESNIVDNMGIGAYIVRVIALYGRVAKYFNQGGIERDARHIWDSNSDFLGLAAEADRFANTLPERLHYTTENVKSHITERIFCQFIFVHLSYHQIRLFLHKSAIPPTPDEIPGMPREFVKSASDITVDAATQIAKILEDVEERGAVVAAPFMGYCAFSSALIHLVRMFTTEDNAQIEAKKYMEVCLRFLLNIRQYWGLFCYITDNLKRTYRKFSEAVAKGSSLSGLSTHQETGQVLQYGDWFQKYPQGVPPSDYEGNTKKESTGQEVDCSSEDAIFSQRSNLQTAEEYFAKLGPRSQRSTPSVPPLSKRQTQSHTRASPAHGSTSMHSASPQSVHHSQSPAVYQSPTMQQSPVMGVSPPVMVPTPPMVSGHGNIDLKLDPQLLNPPMLRRPSDTSPVNFEQSSQHHPPMSSLIPNISSPVSFSNYPVIPRTSAATVSPISTGMHASQQQDYFYDLYPGGSDPSTMAAATGPLGTGIWTGFDPHIGLTDANVFHHDQASSAWFLPFNSCPPGYEARGAGMLNMNMLSGDGGDGAGGGNEGGGDGGNGGGVPHMISPSGGHAGPGAPPSATTYHDSVR